MNSRTKERAIKALEGMRLIVSRDMLVKGEYVTDEVYDPSRSKQVCMGRKYCAIGSLWVGAGVRPVVDDNNKWHSAELPGVDDEGDRDPFLARRPALRAAYDAINEAAQEYADKNGLAGKMRGDFVAPVEALFESESANIGRPELLKIISSAKRKLVKA